MEKLGFLRHDALLALNDLQNDADYLPDEDKINYYAMSNEELAGEMCMAGLIHDEDMGGVFDELPAGMKNAIEVVETTGWPPSL
jgi:hypothetical protein